VKRSDVIAAVRAHHPLELPSVGLRASAVLVALREMSESDGFELILTRRTEDLPSHAGQVSFPGGGMKESDDGPEFTALRETEEELGVDASLVTVVGPLDHLNTITGYHVVPIVGIVPTDIAFNPSALEVARVFTVPLNVFLDDSRWVTKVHTYKGSEISMQELHWDGENIWGATAYMIQRFCYVLKRFRP
jgi:8-oxo-dGTP pyrophosphatase MutT (NUDIX family)